MRILFATSHAYLPDRVGGSESSIHDLCLALRSHGARVAVLARTRARRPPPARGLARLRRRLGSGVDRRLGYPVMRRPSPEESVAEAVARFRPDAAVVQVGRPFALAQAFRRAGVPTTVYLRDVQFHDLGGPVLRERGVAYLVNSRFAAARVRESFGLEAAVIPPLVLPERYRTVPRGEGVLFVNPVPVKGFELAARLVRARPDVPFEFVEAWPVFERLRGQWQATLGDAPNVSWRRPVLDMRQVYAGARVLLVPSLARRGVWEEAWGRVVTEAQLSGIPVLASRSGGLPEAVGPGGLLLEADAAPETWAKALSRLWDDPHEHAALSAAAQAWSLRPEIQPSELLARFLAALAR